MSQESLERHVLRGAERYKTLKDRQYALQLPLGVYTSDLPICVLLAEMPGTDEELIERITAAAEQLSRLRASAVGSHLPMSSDATAVLALASIPGDQTVPAAAEPVAEPEPAIVPPAAEPEPCRNCAELERQIVELKTASVSQTVTPTPVAVGACEHVGSDGKCEACTGDKTFECSNCNTSIVAANGTPCKSVAEGEDCESLYCAECRDDNINEHGYCENCSTVECDGCNESVDRGTEKSCGRTFCTEKPDYCEDCAARRLNAAGLCPTCSGEDEEDCSGCENTFTASRLTRCKTEEDCNSAYCDDCKEDGLSEHGFCTDCSIVECSQCNEDVERGSEKSCSGEDCDQLFCQDCAGRMLNTGGLCSNCSDEEDEDCSDCGTSFTNSRLTACKNVDDCDHAYCDECKEQNLERRTCQDCRDSEDDD